MQEQEWIELKKWLVDLDAICEDVDSVSSISRLDLSDRDLEELPESIGLLTNLIALNLAKNSLESLPESFSNLTKLSNLDIRRNRFKKLPDLFSKISLRSINASGNQLEEISVLQQCDSIRVLDLSANGLRKIDKLLPSNNELRTLNLSCNLISDISSFIKDLQEVERLNLNSNIIESVPSSMASLESIEELDLSHNNIKSIDMAFFDLEVEILDLSANNLKNLTLCSLDSLDKIILDENMFETIEIKDDFAPYLTEFSCDSCNLSEFLLPASQSLEVLCYSSNNITTIPDDVWRYSKLTQLDIDENQIKELPDSLANLVYLQTFYARGNPLNEYSKKVIEVLSPDICDLNMKTNITIELASEEDLSEMAKLLSVLFAIEKDFTFDYEKQHSGINKLFNYEGAELLVAKDENEVVGMVTMQRLISSAEGSFIGQIEDLVVKPEYRKMGIGSRLINKMRTVALEHGYKRIQLAADVDNANALHFYNKRGFYRTNLSVYHYGIEKEFKT